MAISTTESAPAAQAFVRHVHGHECVAVTTPYARELYVRSGSAPRQGGADGAVHQAERLYRRLARALARRGASLLAVASETVFCRDLGADRQTLLACRRAAYGRAGAAADRLPPLHCIEQPPGSAGQAFELQAYAVAPAPLHVPAIEIVPGDDERPTASIVELAGVKHWYVGDITGRAPADAAAPFAAQCQRMFERAERFLQSRGASYRDVVRTWCYLAHIDRDYAAFNDCRSQFFRRLGLVRLPASTGIGAGLGPGDVRCGLGLYVLTGAGGAAIDALHSPTLNEAPSYGALFARGLRLRLPDKTVLLVSGTASVDEQGKSAHVGDVAAQAARMLHNVGRLLAGGGADWDDVVQAIVYLKSAGDLPLWQAAWQAGGYAPLPTSVVAADLCRPELLCEMEVVALLPAEARPVVGV